MTAKSGSKPLIVVSGPTASGKSGFAIKLAKEINAEIINIDSVQVYSGFNIGAAKCSEKEMEEIPHHLIDVIPADGSCNVANYCELAKKVIGDIHRRGKEVILTGGTTMYITCLLQGLDDLPDSDSELRQELEALESTELVGRLKIHDPESLKVISPQDRIRLVRALEASIISGKPASQSKRENKLNTVPEYQAFIIILCRKREELYQRINQRVSQMMSSGLIEETKSLIAKYGKNLPGLKSLGYAQVMQYLNAEIKLEEVEETIAMLTRRFAKRQMTYWRNEPPKKNWSVRPNETDKFLEIDLDEESKGKKGIRVLDWDFGKVVFELVESLDQADRSEVWYLSADRAAS